MSKSSASPWYRGRAFGEEWVGEVFVTLSPSYIRLSLRDLEAYKTPALWVTNADWLVGYDAICKQGASLLMDATDRIVREIRALRDGVDTPLAEQDPALDPFTLGLTSLRDIEETQLDPAGTTAQILARIEALQTAANQGDAESLEELLRIGAIIAGIV